LFPTDQGDRSSQQSGTSRDAAALGATSAIQPADHIGVHARRPATVADAGKLLGVAIA